MEECLPSAGLCQMPQGLHLGNHVGEPGVRASEFHLLTKPTVGEEQTVLYPQVLLDGLIIK